MVRAHRRDNAVMELSPIARRISLALALALAGSGGMGLASLAQASVSPAACNDFDAYINQAWRDSAELPPDRARVGTFDTLRMANDRLLERALVELVADPAQQRTPGLKLLAAYYRSGSDVESIERRGLASVQPWLQRIAAVQREQLPMLLADLARHRIAVPLTLFVSPDAREPTRHVLSIGQSGLTLPDRDDYLKTDAESLRLQAASRTYAARLHALAGELDAASAARPAADVASAAIASTVASVESFEAELARAALTRTQRRDPQAQYNPHTLASLQALAPGFAWDVYLKRYVGDAADVTTLKLVVSQPAFAQAMAKLAAQAPIEQWRHYLRQRLLDELAEKLPREWAQAHFDFRRRALRGLHQPPRRAEQLLLAIGGPTGFEPLGQALGELYVSRAFSAQAQRRALQMVEDIRAAMAARIRASSWMTAPTQQAALAKLQAMVAQVGAPSLWRRYEGLELADDDYAGNSLRVSAWATREALADLPRPVDRQRWVSSPHVVNAFAASGNRIALPAGILQPPFFDEHADDASNYGAIGMVIGHEITHHFDDRGRQYDAQGALRDWWGAEDAAGYKARAERLATFFSRYEPLPGTRINGHQMLGENISDLGGVQIAYDGLQLALKRAREGGQSEPLINGHTPEQRYFIANATLWRSKDRAESLMQQLRTGQHSPGRFRVLGPLTHTAAFAQAFGCKPGDAMVAAEPIVIW